MLVYKTLWTLRHYSNPPASCAPIHPQLDLFITRQMHGITMHWPRVLLSHCSPSPSSPAGSQGSNCWLQQQLGITTAACSSSLCRHQHAAAHEQPSGTICQKEGLCQARWGRRKLLVSLFVNFSSAKSSLHKPCQLPARERIQKNLRTQNKNSSNTRKHVTYASHIWKSLVQTLHCRGLHWLFNDVLWLGF